MNRINPLVRTYFLENDKKHNEDNQKDEDNSEKDFKEIFKKELKKTKIKVGAQCPDKNIIRRNLNEKNLQLQS